MGFYYDGKYYDGNAKGWKYNTRKAKKERKKAGVELEQMMGIALLPIALPALALKAICGGKKKKKK